MAATKSSHKPSALRNAPLILNLALLAENEKLLNRELRHWERIDNTIRPRQALGYSTPLHFLLRVSSLRKE